MPRKKPRIPHGEAPQYLGKFIVFVTTPNADTFKPEEWGCDFEVIADTASATMEEAALFAAVRAQSLATSEHGTLRMSAVVNTVERVSTPPVYRVDLPNTSYAIYGVIPTYLVNKPNENNNLMTLYSFLFTLHSKTPRQITRGYN